MTGKTAKSLKRHLEAILKAYGCNEYVIVFSENTDIGLFSHFTPNTVIGEINDTLVSILSSIDKELSE